jgi:hypothetical protein
MAKKTFLVDLDLQNNQLINATLQNSSSPPSLVGKIAGFAYWNTTDRTVYVYSGLSSPNEWVNLAAVHPVVGAVSPLLSGSNVLATLVTNAQGHITSATTRTMTLSDLGYTGSPTANNYVHPSFTGNSLAGGPLTGALVISNVVVNADGHVTGFSTRSMTNTDIGAAPTNHTQTLSTISDVTASAAQVNLLNLSGLSVGWVLRATSATTAAWGQLKGSQIENDLVFVTINDSATQSTTTWSSTKIASEIAVINSAITGGLVNKGGYDANTNTPLLDSTPIAGIKNGWTFVITAAGLFYTESVQIGDMIVANRDNPTALSHWTVVNKNIADIVQASTAAQGIIQLATATEVQIGTDVNKAVTPSTLSSRTATEARTGLAEIATQTETNDGTDDTRIVTPLKLSTILNATTGNYTLSFGDGTATSFNFTHGLASSNVSITVYEVVSNIQMETQNTITSSTVVNVAVNMPPTSGQYRVLIQK